MDEKKPLSFPSIDKPWQKYYTEAALHAAVPDGTLYQAICRNNDNRMDGIAINYYGRKITYREFLENTRRAAKAFWVRGIRQGDVVTILSLNTPETLYSIYGLNMIGAVANMLYANVIPAEVEEKLKRTDSKMLLILDKLMEKLGQSEYSVPTVVLSIQDSMPFIKKTVIGLSAKKHKELESYRDFIKGTEDVQVRESSSAELPAVILYTSGSTGEPKGVVLTNRNVNAVAEQCAVSGKNYAPTETFLDIIPAFIAFGFGMQHLCHYTGLTEIIVLLPEKKAVMDMLKKQRPNRFVLGPAILEIIEEYKHDDLSFVIELTGGGAALAVEKEREINAILEAKHANSKYLAGYGMTELASAAAMNQNTHLKEQSIGIPLPLTVVKVIDPDTGSEKPYGEEGELLVSSPAVMQGYYKDPDATAETVETIDGMRWLHTGDIARIDEDGFIFITGRIKRIYTVKDTDGCVYKMFPQRLEELVCTLPDVEKCAVIVQEDKEKLFVPIVYVMPRNGAEANDVAEKAEKLIRESQVSYYHPKKVIVLTNMPVTNSQKIDYRALERRTEAT